MYEHKIRVLYIKYFRVLCNEYEIRVLINEHDIRVLISKLIKNRNNLACNNPVFLVNQLALKTHYLAAYLAGNSHLDAV